MASGHFLILCCFGGMPFIDFDSLPSNRLVNKRHQSAHLHPLDLTDWIAADESGNFLNATLHPDILMKGKSLVDLIPSERPSEFSLENCNLWNLSFSSSADEKHFLASGTSLLCRCPRGRSGKSCQFSDQKESNLGRREIINSLPTFTKNFEINTRIANMLNNTTANITDISKPEESMGANNSSTASLMILMLFMLTMAWVFMMLRHCLLCDCFGGCLNPFSSKKEERERPVDPNAINRCLERIRNHEENEINRSKSEANRPLILSVSETCPPIPINSSGYTIVPPPSISAMGSNTFNPQRSHSPPPSYRSECGSFEKLPR